MNKHQIPAIIPCMIPEAVLSQFIVSPTTIEMATVAADFKTGESTRKT